MPYRMGDDGRLVATRMDNRPRRGQACPPGVGCVSQRGVGAIEGPVATFGGAPAASDGPALSRGDAVALASGARIGERAARYAIQVVRGRGLAGIAGLAGTY